MRKWIIRILIIAAAGAALALVAWGFLPKPALVELAPVSRGPFESYLEEDGRTRVEDRFTVSSPVAGYAERLPLKPGQAVARAVPLLRILPLPAPLLDPRARLEAQARVNAAADADRQAQASSARAQEAFAQAQRDLDRAQGLASAGALPRVELERASSAYRSRKSELASARYAEQIAAHQLEDARAALGWQGESGRTAPFVVTSPAAGRVLRIEHPSAGAVAAGTPLLELGDLGGLEVVAEVLTQDAVALRPGMRAVLDRWGGPQPLPAHVREVEPSAFTKVSPLGTQEQRVNVILDLDAPPAQRPGLGDGYELDVRVITWSAPEVTQVPASAVFRHLEGWGAYVQRGGRARLRPVELGHRNPLTVEVLSGLAPGEQVILHPGDTVSDGARVAARQ